MIRSRRSAARSLVLLRLAQACMRSGRLEMISVWLLFVRLLRATTGVRRPNEIETEGRRDSLNQQQKGQDDLSKSISMETSQLQDQGETQEQECQHSKDTQNCLDLYFLEGQNTEKENSQISTQHKNNDDINESGTDKCTNQEEHVMIFETEYDKLNMTDSMPSLEPSTDHQQQGQIAKEEANSLPIFEAEKTEPQAQHQAMEEETNNTESFNAKNTDQLVQGQPIEDSADTTTSSNEKVIGCQICDQSMKEDTNNIVCFDANETDHQKQHQPIEQETNCRLSFDESQTGYQGQGQKMEKETKSSIYFDAVETDQQVQGKMVEPEINSRSSVDKIKTAHHKQDQLVEEKNDNLVSLDAKQIGHQVQDQPVEQETKKSFSFDGNMTGQHGQDHMVETKPHSIGCFDVDKIDHNAPDQQVEEEAHITVSFDAKETEQQVQDQPVEQQTNRKFYFNDNKTGHQEKDQPMDDKSSLLSFFDASGRSQAQEQNVQEETHSIPGFNGIKADHLVQGQQLEEKHSPLSFFDANETGHQAQDQTLEKDSNTTSDVDAKDMDHLVPQETALEQQIKELVISEASTESCQDNDKEDLSDCLHAEMAIVSSDSDNEEQWKSMFFPVVDEDEFGVILDSDIVNQDLTAEDDVTNCSGHKAEHTEDENLSLVTWSTDILEQPTECPTECELEDISYDSIHYSSLSKIPKDKNIQAKHSFQCRSASTSELDKKLPKDYCVIQEMRSEHVSTEHVDFKMARQQWKKMEEQSKGSGQVYKPTLKQDTCQECHSFMYTPVRNLKRSKRDLDSDSLGLSLSDYQFTQISPCSDDSGLDEISYRSNNDEPETPIEREIRETIEREECFKRERAMSRPPSDEPLPNKSRPVSLLTGKSDPDEKKMYNTREDRYRTQRPSCSRPPTLSITASSSPKASYHEMVANNVIILEPDSLPTSPRIRVNNLLSPVNNRFHEWPSDKSSVIILETSNLIIRSASEFCLSSASQETQESTFHNNPFFKLRSHSTQSLVDQEIKEVRKRDEEFRRQRAQLYAKEKYDTILVSPNLPQSFTYTKPGGVPTKCKSSPSSPLRVRKMDHSTFPCDQKFSEAPCTRVRRKSALVQRWEAAMFVNQQQRV